MDQKNQGPTVFDINNPQTYGASPSARPVITGQQPQVPDPMVTPTSEPNPAGSKINVKVDDGSSSGGMDADALASSLFPKEEAKPNETTEEHGVPSGPPAMEGEPLQSPPFKPDGDSESSAQRAPYMPVSALTGINANPTQPIKPIGNEISDQQVTTEPKPGVFGSHSREAMGDAKPAARPKPKTKWWLWIVIAVLAVLVGLYAAVDKGWILSSVNLPVHIFKHSTPATTGPSTTPPANNLPTGFAATKLVEAGVSFNYPSDWGAPSAAVDQGFTKRTKDGKPDTPHAYQVTFPNNKDVELDFTSGKVLPPARTATYYDLLGWCVGTVDGNFYAGALFFTTTNNVDVPSTVACTQVLTNATKLTSDTIVQTGLKASDGSTVDIYTKNLTNPNFVVAHVKDVSEKNGVKIKTMLGTIQNL